MAFSNWSKIRSEGEEIIFREYFNSLTFLEECIGFALFRTHAGITYNTIILLTYNENVCFLCNTI